MSEYLSLEKPFYSDVVSKLPGVKATDSGYKIPKHLVENIDVLTALTEALRTSCRTAIHNV